MTEQSSTKSSPVSYDRSLDTLTQIRTQRHSEPLQFLGPGRYADKQAMRLNCTQKTISTDQQQHEKVYSIRQLKMMKELMKNPLNIK